MFNTIRSRLSFSFLGIFLIVTGLVVVTSLFIQNNNHLVERAIDRDFYR